MNQQIFIIILVIFLLSSNFSKMFQNIVKNFGYLILILSVIKIINPTIEENIKLYLVKFINSDTETYSNILSGGAASIKNLVMSSFYKEDRSK
jgi:hypothetical protein